MANPRAKVDFTGIAQRRATYNIDGVTILYDRSVVGGGKSAAGLPCQGRAVTMSGQSTVALAADAQVVKGRLEKVEADGKCTITTKGYVKLPRGTGAALTPGLRVVGALLVAEKGYIREATAGESPVLGRGEIIDSTVATAGADATVEL